MSEIKHYTCPSTGIDHHGVVIDSKDDFDVIDCKHCRFKHIIPIPTIDQLEKIYQHDYYKRQKPLYIQRHVRDLEWWNLVYAERYEILERFLKKDQRCILDIGSGPGFFLLKGKNRGWHVLGVEPSMQAADYSRNLGLEIINDFFSEETAPKLGCFDVINMSEVLEHIPDPSRFLSLVHNQLNDGGIVCISVPNDFNPFQIALRDHFGFKPWWIGPPHHINYFDFDSLSILLERSKFNVVYTESTFPIDIFLLMGDNYIENDSLGMVCHQKRKEFELNLNKAGITSIKRDLYKHFADLKIGREIIIFAKMY